MHKWIIALCCLASMALMAACGHKSMVVLVPNPDGSVGQINVSNAAGSVEISQANQATVIRSRETAPGTPDQLDPATVKKLFGKVMSNQPLPPTHFILYFQSDSVELLPDSSRELPEIVAAAQQRAPTRISVVGHSDTMGDMVYNHELSMRRALAVKQLLVERGIDDTFMEVTSHGEENPLVKTGDNVPNAQNRRVEVIVR